jgi:hypothetical protein
VAEKLSIPKRILSEIRSSMVQLGGAIKSE